LGVAGILFGLMAALPEQARLIYALSAPCCAIELYLYFRDGERIDYRWYWTAWACAGLSTGFWAMDLSPAFCQPSNHILPLHGLWHLGMASSLVLLFRYYEQFPEVAVGHGRQGL